MTRLTIIRSTGLSKDVIEQTRKVITATRISDPTTAPPPRTRSNSEIPVGKRISALVSSSEILRGRWAGSGKWTIADGRIDLGGGPVDFLIGDRLLVLTGSDGTEVYARDDAA